MSCGKFGRCSLRPIFLTGSWSDEDRRQIRTEYLKVLLILTLTKWLDLNRLDQFRLDFFSRPDRNDGSLPLLGDQLAFLGRSDIYSSNGSMHSFPSSLKNAIISIQEVSFKERLPFMENSSKIGSGSFSSISKVVIAPRFLLHETELTQNS